VDEWLGYGDASHPFVAGSIKLWRGNFVNSQTARGLAIGRDFSKL
jgi:hypothetical protein